MTVPTNPQELLAWSRSILARMAEDDDLDPGVRAKCAAALVQSAQLEIRLAPKDAEAADDEAAELEAQLRAPGLRRVK